MRIFGAIHGLGRRQQPQPWSVARRRSSSSSPFLTPSVASYNLTRQVVTPHPPWLRLTGLVAARLPDPVTPHPKRGLDFVRLAVSAREGW